MEDDLEKVGRQNGSSRLSKAERRRQLLGTALMIVREEGADRLTLGHLAARAGVSKPITYEHFGTRAGLLIEIYKSLDGKQVNALQEALSRGQRSFEETVGTLAAAYINCSADTSGEWHAVGAALSGSNEMVAVQQELIDGYVRLFALVLEPHSKLLPAELHRRCVGLVGAGEALSVAMVRGDCSASEATAALSALIKGGVAS